MKADLVVDARYKSCPGPLLALVEAVAKSSPGQVIMLLTTDPAAPRDIKEWALSVGHEVLKIEKVDDVYQIYVGV
ncbi:MAG: sulfurtransferase TusA family protein [Desulfurococcaceae archaeon TW002]